MTRRATFKQADVTKALRAAERAGLKVSGYSIDPITGVINIQTGGAAVATTNSFDRLMGPR